MPLALENYSQTFLSPFSQVSDLPVIRFIKWVKQMWRMGTGFFKWGWVIGLK